MKKSFCLLIAMIGLGVLVQGTFTLAQKTTKPAKVTKVTKTTKEAETTKATKVMTKKKGSATFILVHAAWLGGWSWSHVEKQLEAQGHKVVALDLPGHGRDHTDARQITMDSYVNKVITEIDRQKQKVILVGHSFAGVVISQVAEKRSHKIRALIYLTAFLLPNGQSFLSATKNVKTSLVLNNLIIRKKEGFVLVKPSVMHRAFGADIPHKAFTAAAKMLAPEPLAPLAHKLKISQKAWGSLPRYYIQTLADQAIPAPIQKNMYTTVGVTKVYTLKGASHLPIFSAPRKVSNIFHDVAQREEARESVKQVSQKWIQAFNRGDLQYCANTYQQNAMMGIFGVGTYKSRSQIRSFWSKFVKATKARGLQYQNTIIKVINADRVHLRSDWSMNVGKGVIGLESWVRGKKGEWKLELDQFRITKKY